MEQSSEDDASEEDEERTCMTPDKTVKTISLNSIIEVEKLLLFIFKKQCNL